MGIKEWNSKKSQSFTFGRNSNSSSRSRRQKQSQCIILGQRFDQDHDHDHDNQGSRWKLLWRRIKREKQRILGINNHNNNSNNVHNNLGSAIAAYDADAYSRNFDDGFECREPEYFTRSFSARFADPSRIVHHKLGS